MATKIHVEYIDTDSTRSRIDPSRIVRATSWSIPIEAVEQLTDLDFFVIDRVKSALLDMGKAEDVVNVEAIYHFIPEFRELARKDVIKRGLLSKKLDHEALHRLITWTALGMITGLVEYDENRGYIVGSGIKNQHDFIEIDGEIYSIVSVVSAIKDITEEFVNFLVDVEYKEVIGHIESDEACPEMLALMMSIKKSSKQALEAVSPIK